MRRGSTKKQVTTRQIRAICRALRSEAPPRYAVRVRLVEIAEEGDYGSCEYRDWTKPPHFLIRLRRGMDHDLAFFVLTHEWAHALSWFMCDEDHDKVWGEAYSRCWRAVSGCR